MTILLLDSDIFLRRGSDLGVVLKRLDKFFPGIPSKLFGCKPGGYYYRKSIYPDYKANRPPVPNDVKIWVNQQFDLYPIIEPRHGTETDDMIALFVNKDTIIVSIDKDFLQLPCLVFNPDTEVLQESKNPIKNLYMQILMGDSADNYPGAIGIGLVKARSILYDCYTEEECKQACLPYFKTEADFWTMCMLAKLTQTEDDVRELEICSLYGVKE